MTSLEDVKAAKEAADVAERALLEASDHLRRTCVNALNEHPLRQVSIAGSVSRNTLYRWAADAKTATQPATKETQP